ncbi:MAG: trimethylamine methyltransferase family protein, partial [Pseudomonadota bacterium]
MCKNFRLCCTGSALKLKWRSEFEPVRLENLDVSAQPNKRNAGRRGRAARHCVVPVIAAPQSRAIPAYCVISDKALAAIEAQADWILEHIGVEFGTDSYALDLFSEAGAHIRQGRVRCPAGLARELCKTAPSKFLLHARDPSRTVVLGGDHVVLMPGYGAPFVTDLENGRRYATLKDFRNFVKLAYGAPCLHHSGGTVCEPTDVPVNKRHLDMVHAHLTLSTKPF